LETKGFYGSTLPGKRYQKEKNRKRRHRRMFPIIVPPSPERSYGPKSIKRISFSGSSQEPYPQVDDFKDVGEHVQEAVSTEELSKSYGSVKALRSLNLKVPEKSVFGLLGPNGAGKTTTIKLLLGLIKPTSGQGRILDQDIEKNSLDVRRHIGYLAQIPSYYTYMTAREILLFKLRFYYEGEKETLNKRVQETLEMMELGEKADRPIRGFSGGERQRLGIAQAVVHRPDLLILDEPAANLDPMGRHEVLTLMEGLRQHATIIYSTHILNDVQHVSDTVAILNKGELLAQAPVSELLKGSGAVIYEITIKGDFQNACQRIRSLPWVLGVKVVPGESRTTLEVSVTDEAKAEEELPKLTLLSENLAITEFARKRLDLEDAFMQIVEGAKNGA
jgi:ABC-2 type transport system ATP-binding protein